MPWSKLIGTGVLAILLQGCAFLPKVAKVQPPVELLQPCAGPEGKPTTNAGLLRDRNAYKLALRACNDQITALREWAKD